jgi:hypothetical protein
MTDATEHKFLADFQPLQFQGAQTKSGALLCSLLTSALNTAALFSVFYVIGRGLKLGLGL